MLIDDYILASKTMENTSDGGSVAYHFDDVVLVKYTLPKEYGQARDMEEKVMIAANRKRKEGVRTPYHIAIKRVIEGKNNVCYSLQERAKGESYHHYSLDQIDIKEQLELQQKILNAPEKHYEKCISDLCSLFHMGLEVKAKNIYYDEDKENGGFTFIDLSRYDETPLNPFSIEDVIMLQKYTNMIYSVPRIFDYNRRAVENEKKRSKKIYHKTLAKNFLAMEKVLPHFDMHRRFLLREYDEDTLMGLSQNGIFVGNLELTEEEEKIFDQRIQQIVCECYQKIESGNYKLWQIEANEIRRMLCFRGLEKSYLYHRKNERRKEDFENLYDYQSACKKDLEEITLERFYQYFDLYQEESNNIFIKQANEDRRKNLEKMNQRNTK